VKFVGSVDFYEKVYRNLEMDHFNAGQRGMAAAMVYPEVKHGGSR
jgi:hypothetical protein